MRTHWMRLPAMLLAALVLRAAAADAAPRFESYEIRVIRPRYFVKAGHLELAAGLGTIVNQTFLYSFLATGLMTYHFSETMAAEIQGGYATNIDRQDKRLLKDDFGIKTVLLTPAWVANGRFVWTPSYGKFNITASRIVYFETNLAVGFGTTSIRYTYDYCETPPPARSKQYPTIVLGASQRYFLDKHTSLRLGIEDQRFTVDSADAACTPDAASATASHDNLLLFITWSYYL